MKEKGLNLQISDQEIIHGLKEKNEDILSIAMHKYEHYFYAIGKDIIRPYGNGEDIAECFVDTWFYIWNNINVYDTKNYSFLNWCLLIFKSRIINKRIYNIRQYQKYQKIVLNNLANISLDVDDILVDKEAYQHMINTIHRLPDPKNKIFLMRYVKNKSLSEISLKTKLSIEKIYYHIYTGKKLLQAYLLDQTSNNNMKS